MQFNHKTISLLYTLIAQEARGVEIDPTNLVGERWHPERKHPFESLNELEHWMLHVCPEFRELYISFTRERLHEHSKIL